MYKTQNKSILCGPLTLAEISHNHIQAFSRGSVCIYVYCECCMHQNSGGAFSTDLTDGVEDELLADPEDGLAAARLPPHDVRTRVRLGNAPKNHSSTDISHK